MKIQSKRYRNARIGLAAGDAWGYQVEFMSYRYMKKPVPQPIGEWKISDDTQMTLALENAVSALDELNWIQPKHVQGMEEIILSEFTDWAESPLNNRAPGVTCMSSISTLNRFGTRWFDKEHGATASAGCGAVMRLLPTIALEDDQWKGATALQAVITHNHPAAVASALLLGEVARALATGETLRSPLAVSLDVIAAMRSSTYEIDDLLAHVLEKTGVEPKAYLKMGVEDQLMERIFSAVDRLLLADDGLNITERDVCEGVGEGWDAMSATALAILVADRYVTGNLDAREALEWAVTSNGDSDSIGAIAGMLIGLTSADDEFWSKNGVNPTFEEYYQENYELL